MSEGEGDGPLLGGPRRTPRILFGLLLTVVGLPGLTFVLVRTGRPLSLESVLLLNLLVVAAIAVVARVVVAVAAAVLAVLLTNWFFVPPFHTMTIAQRDHVIALGVFVVVAVTVSVVTKLVADRDAAAARVEAEASVLARVAGGPIDEVSVRAVLEQTRRLFGMRSVALVRAGEAGGHGDVVVLDLVGEPLTGKPTLSVPAGGELRLVAEGRELFAEDRSALRRFAAAAAHAAAAQQLSVEAAQARALAEVDRLRSALLAAVGHDLRTPLAAIKAGVSGLRQDDVSWSPAERDELLATIEESADRLDGLVANLLDMSRLQAGVLSVDPQPTPLAEVCARALLGLAHHDLVDLDVPDDLTPVHADPGLLERVVANLLANAVRHSPLGQRVQVIGRLGPQRGRVQLAVIDHGPGVPARQRERMFAPFQRLDDRSVGGVGLGLAIAKGFAEAMGASVTPSDTPNGGLTMVVDLPVSQVVAAS